MEGYESWLRDKWIFGLAAHHDQDVPAELKQAPHLLDFHTPSRPEFIAFWTLMIVCFLIGFWPKAHEPPRAAADAGAL